MARIISVDLDSGNDPQEVLARVGGESDKLSMHKRDAFRIINVVRLHPRPIDIVSPTDPQYPFESNAAAVAQRDSNGRFRITTPELKQDNGGIKLQGNLYMLDWDPETPPPERPGPHFRVFP